MPRKTKPRYCGWNPICQFRRSHALTNVLIASCLVAVVVVGGAAVSGAFMAQSNIYNQYNTEDYTDPKIGNAIGNLDFQLGLPFIQGVYPTEDPVWGDITFSMIVVGGEPVYRIGYNATVYTDVYDCWFTSDDMRLNRGMGTEQNMYLGPLALVNLLEITRIQTRVDAGTYTRYSAHIVTGELYFHIVVGAWDAWHFIDLAATGWIDVPLGAFPITVYQNQVTTYILGQAFAELILDMV